MTNQPTQYKDFDAWIHSDEGRRKTDLFSNSCYEAMRQTWSAALASQGERETAADGLAKALKVVRMCENIFKHLLEFREMPAKERIETARADCDKLLKESEA